MVSFGCKSEISFNLPMHFLPHQSQLMPNWEPYTKEEKSFENVFVKKDEIVSIEKEATKQVTYNKLKSLRENRTTSSYAHKIFIRKKKNHCLKANSVKKKKKILKFVHDAFKHGRRYDPVARRKYYEIIQYKMKQSIFLERLDLLYNPWCSG